MRPTETTSRRAFLASVATAASAIAAARLLGQPPRQPAGAAPRELRDIVVYKDPNCGCCAEWVKHLKGAGFKVNVQDTKEMDTVKRSFGVPKALESCHTGRIGKYTIEGHVPADLIVRLLNDQPKAIGLAVAGMPMGSPGMEGGRKDAYEVLLFDTVGNTSVYAKR